MNGAVGALVGRVERARVASRTLLGTLDPWEARGPDELRARQRRVTALLVALAAMILAADYASAPFVRLPPFFIVPIAFFSIFAGIFGSRSGGTDPIRMAVVDEDHSELSRRLDARNCGEFSLHDDGAGAKQPQGAAGCSNDGRLDAALGRAGVDDQRDSSA